MSLVSGKNSPLISVPDASYFCSSPTALPSSSTPVNDTASIGEAEVSVPSTATGSPYVRSPISPESSNVASRTVFPPPFSFPLSLLHAANANTAIAATKMIFFITDKLIMCVMCDSKILLPILSADGLKELFRSMSVSKALSSLLMTSRICSLSS